MRLLELASKLKPYVPDWYHELIADHLERCAQGDPRVPNLLISTPPGSGKTELVSIQFPAWVFSVDPTKHVIALANSDSLARLASSNVLRLLRNPDFPRKLTFEKEAEGQFILSGNDGRPSMHAAGISGQLTGQRADFLIFDDLLKNQSESFSETVREKIWADFSSAAETRLLPEGKIIGIQTRWHLDDPVGRLIRRAREDRHARQFIYISLSAWNSGEESFVLDTITGEKKFFSKYKSLASKQGQPYSFSRKQLKGKRADLGPSRWSALYMQNPLTGEDQLFPPECWRLVDGVDPNEIELIVTVWDCASKTGEKNDYSANVVIAGLISGTFTVLDVWKGRVAFAELAQIAKARYDSLIVKYNQLPILVVEDANAGTQLLQIWEYEFPQLPSRAAKPVRGKVIRAEGVTPFTRGGMVSLPRNAEWKDSFITHMANFPVGEHDDEADAFCHGMKCFVTRDDFRKTEYDLLPGRIETDYERQTREMREEAEYQAEIAISPDLDDVF